MKRYRVTARRTREQLIPRRYSEPLPDWWRREQHACQEACGWGGGAFIAPHYPRELTPTESRAIDIVHAYAGEQMLTLHVIDVIELVSRVLVGAEELQDR